MRRKILHALTFAFFVCTIPALAQGTPMTLQQKFAQAQVGDFIVTAQEGNYSLLFIRSITAGILLLEEIAVPEHQIDLKKMDWKNWAANKAPGHTSWTLYEIDRSDGKLIECFSYSKNGWLYLDESEQFLTRLLTLQLDIVPDKERKKIGPPPALDEVDRRAPWNPPLVIEGKKILKPSFEVLKTQWPEDSSRLSQCFIELYFAKEEPAFPFPYWLEVQSPHYAFKMRTIDSGHGLSSPRIGPMPHRAPQILGLAQKGLDQWKLSIKSPAYFQKLHLFALDLSSESKATIPVLFAQKSLNRDEELTLEIATADLKRILQSRHRYQWILIPEGSPDIYIESEETFIWK
jgi:hypothetical protein